MKLLILVDVSVSGVLNWRSTVAILVMYARNSQANRILCVKHDA